MGSLERKQAKEIIKQASTIDNSLKKIIDAEKTEIATVRKNADSFYIYKFNTELANMDIELLAQGKQGIRVSSLKAAGIKNILQLSKMSVTQIDSINGIGAQNATKIHSLVKQIVTNTKSKMSVRINSDEPSEADDALVKSLYILIHHTPVRKECKRIYEENHRRLFAEIPLAKKTGSTLSWFFASKNTKVQAEKAFESIVARLNTDFGNCSRFELYNDINDADITECRADFRANSSTYYAVLEQYCQHIDTTEQSSTGLSDQLLKEINEQPIDLKYMKTTLRGYQTFGVKYAVHQKRTLLGDEMGLGKTIQAIATMASLKADGKHHFMVVCPASVLINWCREIEKHSTLAVTKIHGSDESSLLHWRENGDVAVTTYESISRFELPEKFRFDMLVVDEAHYVKNPTAQRTKAMVSLLSKTEDVLYMSGTPLVNRVDEMCYLVSCLQPQIASQLEKVKDVSTARQFRIELAPVYLRRVRKDVLKELPDLIEKEQWCQLNNKEKSIYNEAVVSGNLMAIRQVSWQVSDMADSSKAQRLLEICDSAREEGRKIIVFSFFRNTLEKVHQLLGDHCLETISGDISPQRRQEIVDEFNNAQPGAVLVSQVQAGGTGLNIQSASVVVFCEPQLTPAIENQAVSRAYRMGQNSDVLVHRLLCEDTIDERMLAILKGKQDEFDNFADDSVVADEQMNIEQVGSSWLTKMVQDEQARVAEQNLNK